MSIFDDLANRTHDVGFGCVIHRQVRVVPVAEHTETDEVDALLVDLLQSVVAAGLAEFVGFDLDADFADAFLDLVFDWQAMTIPAGHVGCVFTI